MRFLNSYGAVWKLSDRAYRRLLADVKADKPWDLDNYGKRIFSVQINVTDLDSESVDEFIRYEREMKGKRR